MIELDLLDSTSAEWRQEPRDQESKELRFEDSPRKKDTHISWFSMLIGPALIASGALFIHRRDFVMAAIFIPMGFAAILDFGLWLKESRR